MGARHQYRCHRLAHHSHGFQHLPNGAAGYTRKYELLCRGDNGMDVDWGALLLCPRRKEAIYRSGGRAGRGPVTSYG